MRHNKRFKINTHLPRVALGIVIFINFFLLSSLLYLRYANSNQQTETSTPQVAYPEVELLSQQDFTFTQLNKYLSDLSTAKGAVYAFEVLKRATLPSNIDIHLLAHVVGDKLYEQKGINGIKDCTDDFRNACSHSLVIALFQEQGVDALDAIAKACREAPGGKGAYTMCFHGLGHGVLAYTDYDMEKAIPLCEKTGTATYRQREYIECVGGMTMEMISGVHNPQAWNEQKTRYFSTSNPLYPCTAPFMPEIVQPQCLNYLTPHLFQTAGANMARPTAEDFDKAFSYCNVIQPSDTENRDQCYGGFGKEFVVLVQDRDIRRTEEITEEQLQTIYKWCNLADYNDGIISCINQATNSLYWGGENDSNAASTFCGLIPLKEQQSACYRNLIAAVGYFEIDQQKKNNFCKELPQQYNENCLKDLSI